MMAIITSPRSEEVILRYVCSSPGKTIKEIEERMELQAVCSHMVVYRCLDELVNIGKLFRIKDYTTRWNPKRYISVEYLKTYMTRITCNCGEKNFRKGDRDKILICKSCGLRLSLI